MNPRYDGQNLPAIEDLPTLDFVEFMLVAGFCFNASQEFKDSIDIEWARRLDIDPQWLKEQPGNAS